MAATAAHDDMDVHGVDGPAGAGDAAPAAFDEIGFLLRARRTADLSQRELAALLGVGQPAISRMESRGIAGVRMLARVLAACGLRLTVVDHDGQPVRPVPRDVVRDNAGRRFPAHLDVAPPDQVPWERRVFPRYDRLPARGWYHHRPRRDEIRATLSTVPDHPTVADIKRRELELRQQAHSRRLARAADLPRLEPDTWADPTAGRRRRRGWRHRAKRRWRARPDDAP